MVRFEGNESAVGVKHPQVNHWQREQLLEILKVNHHSFPNKETCMISIVDSAVTIQTSSESAPCPRLRATARSTLWTAEGTFPTLSPIMDRRPPGQTLSCSLSWAERGREQHHASVEGHSEGIMEA